MAIRIKIVSDLDEKGLKEAQLGLQKLGDFADRSFKAVAVGTGIAAAAFGKFALDSIRAASNLEESTNAVNVSFGKSAEAILAIGKNSAESLGLARNEFNEAAVRFSAFAERISGVGADTSGFIQEITQRAADFASVFNIEVAEALRVFQSGLAGEAEPLKRFGINLLESEVKAYALRAGIISVGESMDETQKVQARYGLLLESTAKTAGDFANTSEGLANSQRILKARFTDLQAEVGQALLPAFTNLFKTVADRVIPEFEKLGAFLSSPQGQKAIADLANTIADLTIKFIENLEGIIKTAQAVATFVVGIKIFKTAVELATTAQLLFNTAVRMNPYVLAATGLLAFVAAVSAFRSDADKARLSAQNQAYQVKILSSEIDNLNTAYRNGAIDQETYETQLRAMQQQMNSAKISTEGTAGEINRFNQLRLDGAIESINQFKLATSLAERQAKSFSDSYSYLESIGAVTRRAGAQTSAAASAIASTGPSAFEQARNKVQDLIRSSQKQLADAQKTLVNAQVNARQNYAENILRIEKDFADRLSGIIQQSQDRLRSAYRTAVEENIAALFDRSEDKSVEGLVKSLSDKLNASRRLLENSAQLASQGFSQTFIEQVVGAGTETGNELAAAILNSTPDVKKQLKTLFSELEKESNYGMDSLANALYQEQGLATDELKRLYEQTNAELTQALEDQARQLDASLRDANNAFIDSVTAIKSELKAQIAEMGGDLGGLGGTVDQFIGKLDTLIAKYKELAEAEKMPSAGTPIFSDTSQMPSGGIAFLPISPEVSTGAMPAPVVDMFPRMPLTQPGLSQPTTIINITAKADSSQSLAMVGKSLGNTVAKYVTGGGQVIVSPV